MWQLYSLSFISEPGHTLHQLDTMAGFKTWHLFAGLCLLVMSTCVCCVSMSQFYPFGDLAGDTGLSTQSSNATFSARVDLSAPLQFFGDRMDSIYVCSYLANVM